MPHWVDPNAEQKRVNEVFAAGVSGLEDWWRCVLDWLGRKSARGAGHVFRFDGSGECGGASTVASNHAWVSRGPGAGNKGMQYPPDPPRAEEIVLVMRQAGHDRHGLRVRALIAVLWRAGLRISEALALNETDIDERRGSLLIRHGKGDKRREAGMDQFGFEQLRSGWCTACRCRPDRCSASSMGQREATAGPRPPPEPNCESSPSTLASGGASLPINMPTSGLCRCVAEPPHAAGISRQSSRYNPTACSHVFLLTWAKKLV